MIATPLSKAAKAAQNNRNPAPVALIAIQNAASTKKRMGSKSSFGDLATTPTEKSRSYNRIATI